MDNKSTKYKSINVLHVKDNDMNRISEVIYKSGVWVFEFDVIDSHDWHLVVDPK